MDGMILQVVEPIGEDSPQLEILELSLPELGQVGAGMCDPGIIIIDK